MTELNARTLSQLPSKVAVRILTETAPEVVTVFSWPPKSWPEDYPETGFKWFVRGAGGRLGGLRRGAPSRSPVSDPPGPVPAGGPQDRRQRTQHVQLKETSDGRSKGPRHRARRR